MLRRPIVIREVDFDVGIEGIAEGGFGKPG